MKKVFNFRVLLLLFCAANIFSAYSPDDEAMQFKMQSGGDYQLDSCNWRYTWECADPGHDCTSKGPGWYDENNCEILANSSSAFADQKLNSYITSNKFAKFFDEKDCFKIIPSLAKEYNLIDRIRLQNLSAKITDNGNLLIYKQEVGNRFSMKNVVFITDYNKNYIKE